MSTDVKEIFRDIVGLPCWNVKRGIGTFITIDFGKPRIRIAEPNSRRSNRQMILYGEWHLWIYDCHWRIYSNSASVATDESNDSDINKWVRYLDGQKLTSVTYNGKETIFLFDLGGTIITYPVDVHNGIDQWILYHEDQAVANLTNAGKICR